MFARPSNPSVKVQRADGAYGQFLPDAGQEVLLDDFLLRRAQEGAVMLTEIKIDDRVGGVTIEEEVEDYRASV